MLAGNLVEGFEIKEDEPWYDSQDLQQGERGRREAAGRGLLKSSFCLRPRDAGRGEGQRSPDVGTGRTCPSLRRLRSPRLAPPRRPVALQAWPSGQRGGGAP